MSWWSPDNVGRLILPKIIKRVKFLKYLPIFRQYAEGGDLSTPERAREWKRKKDEERKQNKEKNK